MLCHVWLYRVSLRIFGFMIIILYLFMSCFPLMFYSTSLLLLSYHIMSSSFLILLVIYLLTLACLCSRHGFSMRVYDPDLSTHLCLSMHATWHSRHHLPGSIDSSGSSCPGLGAWTEGDSSCWGPSLLPGSRQTSCSSSPILTPPGWLVTSPAILWAPFCTVHTCTSLCILTFAPISDVIFL